jgi:hypothetical protein
MPGPSSMDVGIQDINDAKRNTNGNLIAERIATKHKLNIEYKYLSNAAMSTLLTAISTMFFTVTYHNPVTNSLRTGTFYTGDRNLGVMDYRNGNIRYKGVKFNLIEK